LLALASFLLAGLAGCQAYRNEPLAAPATLADANVASAAPVAPPATQPVNATRHALDAADADLADDGLFVGVAFSGGGLRASNFSAASILELDRAGLMSHVDALSAVSGGALAAGYYCVAPDDQFTPDRVRAHLTYRFTPNLWAQLAYKWPAMWFGKRDRTDLVIASFRAHLLDGRDYTFADLRPDRPRLFLNGTDLQTGARFVFCNESFDAIHSDLAKFPLADALAAAVSHPVLLPGITLRNYAEREKRYRHVVDGGVNDDLGVRTLVDHYSRGVERGKYPRGAILIVIDSRILPDYDLARRDDLDLIRSIQAGVRISARVLLGEVSRATLADLVLQNARGDYRADELRSLVDTLRRTGHVVFADGGGRPVEVLHVSLLRLAQGPRPPGQPMPDYVLRANQVRTGLQIDPQDADSLYRCAEDIFRRQYEPTVRDMLNRVRAGSTTQPTAAG
jgi:predicted acylesterase/phospholipase RssA